MNTITSSVTIRALRAGLADAVGRVSYGHERVHFTKNGKPAAVLIGPEDFELLEQLEMMRDVTEYRAVKAVDDGGRVTLKELPKLEARVRRRILAVIAELEEDPYPLGCKKLVGQSNAQRIRI